MNDTDHLVALDRQHVWHPFTPMKQWREGTPLVIARAEGEYLIDSDGKRYIDGVSSLWCNVHGHRVPEIDQAIRDQLDKVAHSTLLGLASEQSALFAGELVARAPKGLDKVFYSDAGATALEAAFKMAVGYWHHTGRPKRTRFVGVTGAYHGDTTGSMSVGYSDFFHKPFASMVFPTFWTEAPDACRPPAAVAARVRPTSSTGGLWPSEDPALAAAMLEHCLADLDGLLTRHGDEIAAVVIEPIMQGAAGMICQPPGYVRGVAALARKHDVLLIADEVAVGFGRTGKLFACEHEEVRPDILCLAKGITGGYLPLAATLATDRVEAAFTGAIADRRTLFHGHTYTGNALACAAGRASLALFEQRGLIARINASAATVKRRLDALRDCPHVMDIRQRGLMIGIELCKNRATREPFESAQRVGAAVCMAMRPKGLIIRPLGDTLVLMPILASRPEVLEEMMNVVVRTVQEWSAGLTRRGT
ncbi:MAG: adenosylmethionine--8-amino-7-oxononanoate transaminase [Planctomycetota bacterium]|nr:adenosylmethionine--8-amino-7-oxononanoate transaminase [Planctomycetota bacterium]